MAQRTFSLIRTHVVEFVGDKTSKSVLRHSSYVWFFVAQARTN